MSILRRLFVATGGVVVVAVLVRFFTERKQSGQQQATDEPGGYDETNAFTEGNGTSSLTQDLAYMAGAIGAGIAAGNVLGAVGLAGDLSQAADSQLRPKTELMLEQLGMEKELANYTRGADKLQGASDTVDTWFDGLDGAMEQGSAEQQFVQGITDTGASIASAPVEIAKLAHTTGTREVASIQSFGEQKTPVGIAIAAYKASLLPAHMASDAVVEGLGGALADIIAQTPEQRQEADRVLELINPSNVVTNIVAQIPKIPPPPPIPKPPPRTQVIPTRANPPPPPPPPKPRSPQRKKPSSDKGGSKKPSCTLTARQKANGKKC
jgi:hypothetical protein